MSKRESLENRAFRLIFERGEEGILQFDLWKKLDVTSREGSKIALKLEAKNIIKRERELARGRWTYRLFSKMEPVEVDSLLGVPCFLCEDIDACVSGTELSPVACDKLSRWLLSYGKPSQEELED